MACASHELGLGCVAKGNQSLRGPRHAELSSSSSVVLRTSRLATPRMPSKAAQCLTPVTAVASPPARPRTPGRTESRQGHGASTSSVGRQGRPSTRTISRPSRDPRQQVTRTNPGLNTVLARIQQKRASGEILQQGLASAVASESPPRPDMQPMERLELERGVCKPFKKYSPERVRTPLPSCYTQSLVHIEPSTRHWVKGGACQAAFHTSWRHNPHLCRQILGPVR